MQAPEPEAPTAATEAADFLLEVGCEELPPAEAAAALEQLSARFTALLATLRLSHSGVRVYGTPRRLAVLVDTLAARQAATTEERRGPPKKRAFDGAGEPTKALLGFCRGAGADPADVTFKADAKVLPTPPCGVELVRDLLLRVAARIPSLQGRRAGTAVGATELLSCCAEQLTRNGPWAVWQSSGSVQGAENCCVTV